MSLVSAWVTPARAMLVCDTAAGTTCGRRHEQTKMLPLVHAKTVLAVRGYSELLPGLLADSMLRGPSDYDAIVEGMKASLCRVHSSLMADVARRCGQSPEGSEIVAVGWSAKAERFAGQVFLASGGGAITTGPRITHWFVAPGEGLAVEDVPDAFPDLPRLRALVRRQIAGFEQDWHREKRPGTPVIGGQMIVADLLPERITIEVHPLG